MGKKEYLRTALCMPEVSLAYCSANVKRITEMSLQASSEGADIILFPELSITGYTCGDLFHQTLLLESAESALREIAEITSGISSLIFVGVPVKIGTALYNCAAALKGGRIYGLVPKSCIPGYNEFYEKRWWMRAPAVTEEVSYAGQEGIKFGAGLIFETSGVKIGAEICEDLWSPVSPSTGMALEGAEVIVNLSASDALTGKYNYLKTLVCRQSGALICAYAYCSAGYGESTTDMVFQSKGLVGVDGRIETEHRNWRGGDIVYTDIDLGHLRHDRMHNITWLDCAADYKAKHPCATTVDCGEFESSHSDETKYMKTDKLPFVPMSDGFRRERCLEILEMQSAGLSRRLEASHAKTAVVGISGGLDSTLALIVTVSAFDFLGLDRKNIIAVTMPGFGTTARTKTNAWKLMELLGCTAMEIPIGKAVELHFKDIGQNPEVHDVTYENCQARERTQILMDLSNRLGGIVVGTGDMSELALGWATYNGDHMSMYGVNAGVPKTLVKYLVETAADSLVDKATSEVLLDIVATPISPELLPASPEGEIKQKTEDLVGPYELHDFFLYHTLRYGDTPEKIYKLAVKAFEGDFTAETIKKWMTVFYKRFFAQQFKRSCLPDGPKIGSVCLSPRGDWRMPSDALANEWVKRAQSL